MDFHTLNTETKKQNEISTQRPLPCTLLAGSGTHLPHHCLWNPLFPIVNARGPVGHVLERYVRSEPPPFLWSRGLPWGLVPSRHSAGIVGCGHLQ